MAALQPTDLTALNALMRKNTPFSRLVSSEIDAIFTFMNANSWTLDAAGTAGSFINTAADFENLALVLRNGTAANRLSFAEAVAAINYIVNTAQFLIARPAALGVG